jgi:protein associated with RNAse G/E
MLLGATIRKMLVDGTQWASWYGYHIPVSKPYFVIWAPLGTQMHWRPGTWTSSKHQLTFFFPDDWFTLHVGYNREGRFISGYVDIVLPSHDYTDTAQELSYTDLYIDVVVNEDYSVYTKDHEVFERAARHYPVVEQSRQQSFAALARLEKNAQNWTGPFAYVPRQLSRTDFHLLESDQASAILRTLTSTHTEQ